MKKNKTKKNKFFSLVFSAFGCIVLAVLACFLAFRIALLPPDSKANARQVRIEVPSGVSVFRIAGILVDAGVVRSDKAFYIAARFPYLCFRKNVPVMKSGYYSIDSSMSALQIMDVLESGKQVSVKVSVPEGLTIRKIAALLEKNGVCQASDFIEAAHNPELLQKYEIPSESFEGFLFPDTYFLAPDIGGEKVVSLMTEAFFDKLSEIPYFSGKSPSQFYETLVLASIVEREYRVEEEAPLIASVFKNRIEAGVGLYSCATIEYIITEIQGRPHPDVITYDDLKIDSPYNTYMWAALPPAPISNPGLVALSAAANPPKTEYFYFTLTDSAMGKHTFSKSFNAHVKAGTQFKTKKSGSN